MGVYIGVVGAYEDPHDAIHNCLMYMILSLPHCDFTFGAMETINIL